MSAVSALPRRARSERWFDAGTLLAAASGLLFVVSFTPAVVGNTAIYAVLWRVAEFILVISGILRYRSIIADMDTIYIFLPWTLCLFIEAIYYTDSSEVWLIFFRTIANIAIVSLSMGPVDLGKWKSRDGSTFLIVLLVGMLVVSAWTALPILKSGWSWDAGRQAKLESVEYESISYNGVLFVVSVCLMAIPWRRSSVKMVLLIVLFILCTVLATRAPAVATLAAVVLSFSYWVVASRLATARNRRVMGLVSAVAIVVPLAILYYITQNPDPDLARTTAGRTYLWQAGMNQWLENPWMGDPRETLQDALNDAYSQFNYSQKWEVSVLYDLVSGGFHSIWIQTLAMYGLFGFSILFYTYWKLLLVGLSLRGSHGFLGLVLLLLFRSFAEYSGLFAYGNAPTDFICAYALVYAYKMSKRASASRRPLEGVRA